MELIKISNEKVDFTHLTLSSVQGSAEVKANAKDEISAMQIPQSQLPLTLLMCMPCPALLHPENVQAISQQCRGQRHVGRGLSRCYLQFQSMAEIHAVCRCNMQLYDYTVHGILQARILEWVAFPFSRFLPKPRIEPRSPVLQVDSLPARPQEKPMRGYKG